MVIEGIAYSQEYQRGVRVSNEKDEILPKVTVNDILEATGELLHSYQKLPPGAMLQPVTHYDLQSVLLLVQALARACASVN